MMDMTLRELILHAPAEPQPWFQPTMDTPRPESGPLDEEGYPLNHVEIDLWDKERQKQRYIQWPVAWAEAVMKYIVKQETITRQEWQKLRESVRSDHPQDNR